jgi:uncharacterized membrane protein
MKKNPLKLLSASILSCLCISIALTSCEPKPTPTPAENSLISIIAEDGATFSGISNNGKWAIGYAFNNNDNAGFSVYASKWDLETGERTILTTSDNEMSEANCINDNGTIIGGAYLNQPAYHEDGEWHILEMPDGYTMGTVTSMAEANGDIIFVGRVQDNADAQSIAAAKWVNGVYERANPDNIRRDHTGEAANVNTCYAISEDGNVIMGSLEFNARPNATPFVVTQEKAFIVELESENDYGLSHIMWPKMSANGKYITGCYRHVIFNAGEQSPSTDTYQACIYDIEKQEFKFFEKNGEEWGGYAVDNNGVVYANTPVEQHPIRQGYVITNGVATELETVLLANGITQEAIDAASAPAVDEYNNKLGTIIAVSRDGKTIIGCAGQTNKYNWVAKLK